MRIGETLADVQTSLLEAARNEQKCRTRCDSRRYDQVIEYLRGAAAFVMAPWFGRGACERRIKEDSSATIRCLPPDGQAADSKPCVCCGRRAVVTAVWPHAY